MTYDDWRSEASAAMHDLAVSGEVFTSDDLIDLVGEPDEDHNANGANSMVGAMFRAAHKGHLIRPVGVTQSKQLHRKGGLIRTWVGRPPVAFGP